MSLEENKKLAFEWLEAFAQCDIERMKKVSADDFKYYLGGELPPSGIIPGKVNGVKEYADSLHVAQVLFGATTGLPARARASVLGPVTRTIVTRVEP